MKTVIIPNDYHPFVIEVNGVKYTYPEGTEQSVPDEVASAIENIYKLAPREGDPNPVPFGVDADGKEEYKSKYTGAEIDAAVAKAGDLSKVTANPTLAGTEAALTGLKVGETKYKVEQPINVVANPTLAGTEAALEGLQVGETKYKVGGGVVLVQAPQAFETALTTAIQSLAAGLAADTKLHKATFSFDTEDADFADIVSFYHAISDKAVRVLCGNIGTVYAEMTIDGIQSKTSVKNYVIIPGLGMGEVILLLNSIVEGTVITEITCDVYVRRIEQAT